MRTRIVGFGLLLLAFAFYVFGASPALDGGDSGEFIAASHTLGISHAPGYPLIALLLKAFQVVLPMGSVAYRCHVFSAVNACTLLGFLWIFLNRLPLPLRERVGVRGTVACAATFFLATRPLFIEQSRVAEVFLLNAVFVVIILITLQEQRFALATFLFGLGLGNHQTLIVVAPVFLWRAMRDKRAWREFIFSGFAFALGLSIYVYLPIRAHASPPVNFGDPETFSRFWAVVTRKEFGALSLHPAAVPFRSGSLLMEQATAFFHRSVTQLGAGGVFICAVGLLSGVFRRQTRLAALLLFLICLGVGFGFEALSNLSPSSDIGQWRLERFMLLPLMAACGFVALAFDEALMSPRAAVRWISTGVLLVCLAPSAWASIAAPNFRWNLAFRDFAINALRSAPQQTRLIIDRVLFDEPTSSLLVATQVENKRPDIHFYYRPGTLFEPVYGKDLLDLTWDERYRRQMEVEYALMASSVPVRCLAFEKRNSPFENPVLEGLLYRPGPSSKISSPPQRGGGRGGAEAPALPSESMLLLRFNPTPVPSPYGEGNQSLGDYPTRLISVHTPYFVGKSELEAGRVDSARRWFDRALAVGLDMAWLHSNIGGIYAQQGLLKDARREFEKAAALDPYFYEGPFGLGFVALKEERLPEAIASLNQAVRVGPERSDGWYMLGVACYESHDRPAAHRAWERYLALDPHGAMAEVVGKKLQE